MLLASEMETTVGFVKARRRARRRVPMAQAVSAVKVGKVRELSIAWIAFRSRGGEARVINSADMVDDGVLL